MIKTIVLGLVLLSLLAGCSERGYVPSDATLAQREQAEYETAVERGQTAWRIGIVAIVLFLAILLVLSAFLARVGYRVQAAKAAKHEAEARRLLLVDIGNGAVLDLATYTVRTTSGNLPSQVRPVTRAEPLPPEQPQQTSLQKFIIDCVRINEGDWQSDVLPRWERWGEIGETMTSAEWMRLTDELVRLRLIVKEKGKRTVVSGDGDMRWLFDQLPPSPTDADQLF